MAVERIRVNGREHPWRPDLSLAELLAELGQAGPGAAVERNGRVVRRADLAATPVAAGDRIEIVRLVGGG
jgi:sulfur carrier protein